MFVRVLGILLSFRDCKDCSIPGDLQTPSPHPSMSTSPTHCLNGQGLCLQLSLQHGALSLDACCLCAGLGLRLGGPGALHSSAAGIGRVRRNPGESPALPFSGLNLCSSSFHTHTRLQSAALPRPSVGNRPTFPLVLDPPQSLQFQEFPASFLGF